MRTTNQQSGPASESRGNIYEEITAKIIAQVEAGIIPWVQPWGGGPSLPINASTKRPYSGVNILLLWDALFSRDYACNQWLTFKQALAFGGVVRKGEKGTTLIFTDRFTPEAERTRAIETGGDVRTVQFLKRFTVFNVAQIDGLPLGAFRPTAPVNDTISIPAAEQMIVASGVRFQIGGEKAFYHTGDDYVVSHRNVLFSTR